MSKLRDMLRENPGAKVIVLYETVLHSLVKDAGKFGSIFALAWLNHQYLGGSWVLDTFAVIAVLLHGLDRTSGNCVTAADLRRIFSEERK